MQLDKKTLDRLLDLSDGQLRVLLKRLLAEYGVDPAAVPLEQMDIGKLREALRERRTRTLPAFCSSCRHPGWAREAAKHDGYDR